MGEHVKIRQEVVAREGPDQAAQADLTFISIELDTLHIYLTDREDLREFLFSTWFSNLARPMAEDFLSETGQRKGQQLGAHPEQEPPLLVVEQADDGCYDDGALRVLGHVAEDRRQAQQHDHHNHTCAHGAIQGQVKGQTTSHIHKVDLLSLPGQSRLR